ncbi:hypothetical protein FACS1894204_09930 [Synergistales bacterium]|nr:hypothetical protein FACS1894204_09930 [Synergistales bacterium]
MTKAIGLDATRQSQRRLKPVVQIYLIDYKNPKKRVRPEITADLTYALEQARNFGKHWRSKAINPLQNLRKFLRQLPLAARAL